MRLRRQFATPFYPNANREQLDRLVPAEDPPALPEPIRAGVVPHAGWAYSGRVAARVFSAIARRETPKTLVLFGSVHRFYGHHHALYDSGGWATPFGTLEVDEELAAEILRAGESLLESDPAAHDGEHSLEVQMPMVKHFLPNVRIVPISVFPREDSLELGRRVAEVMARWPEPLILVGTTDLTHYGQSYHFAPAGEGPQAHDWMRANDRRMIDLALELRAAEVSREADEHSNACSTGALAATLEAARALGSRSGVLLEYTTSFDEVTEPFFRMAVGYAGMLF